MGFSIGDLFKGGIGGLGGALIANHGNIGDTIGGLLSGPFGGALFGGGMGGGLMGMLGGGHDAQPAQPAVGAVTGAAAGAGAPQAGGSLMPATGAAPQGGLPIGHPGFMQALMASLHPGMGG